MSGDTTDVEPTADADTAADSEGGSTAVAVMDRPGELEQAAAEERVELRKDRLWLPFMIPIGAILVVALFTINISRIFLAASQDSKDPAVIVGIILTVAVLIGAAVVAAIPKLRTSSLVITMVVIASIVMLGGSLTLGAAQPQEEASAEPQGPAIGTLTVDATNFQFQAPNFDVPPGIIEIKYVSKEGSHTLAFDEPQFAYFLLAQPGGKDASKIEAVDGETYTIYCTLPGHRAAGMESTMTVKAGATLGGVPAQSATASTTLPAETSSTTLNPGNSETDQSQQSNTSSTGN